MRREEGMQMSYHPLPKPRKTCKTRKTRKHCR
jgi:hypothetical protein